MLAEAVKQTSTRASSTAAVKHFVPISVGCRCTFLRNIWTLVLLLDVLDYAFSSGLDPDSDLPARAIHNRICKPCSALRTLLCIDSGQYEAL